MHESTQNAHGDIQHMANHHDEDEGNPARTAVAQSLQADGIEGFAQLGTCQAKGIKTEVTEHIAQQASGRVVGFPKTRAEIEQRIAVQVVEEEDSQCRQHAKDNDNPFGDSRIEHANQGETTDNDTANDEQRPAPSPQGIGETMMFRGLPSLDDSSTTPTTSGELKNATQVALKV